MILRFHFQVATQGSTTLDVIKANEISIQSITSREYLGPPRKVVVGTRLPSNTFTYSNDASIVISGDVDMKFADGSVRKLRALVGNAAAGTNANVNEVASYELQVGLQDEADLVLEDEVPIGNSGPAFAKEFAILGMATLASYLMW